MEERRWTHLTRVGDECLLDTLSTGSAYINFVRRVLLHEVRYNSAIRFLCLSFTPHKIKERYIYKQCSLVLSPSHLPTGILEGIKFLI